MFTTKEIRELHRNMLFPLRLVDLEEYPPTVTTPVLTKANILMEANLFACNCRNCMESV